MGKNIGCEGLPVWVRLRANVLKYIIENEWCHASARTLCKAQGHVTMNFYV